MGNGNGGNFWYVWDMVQRGYVNDCADPWVRQYFGPTVMLAICWEETEFQNIRQKGCTHDMWMKPWTNPNPTKTADGQTPGNHAVGFVQVERDTIGLWLLFNSELCLGLPGFSADMIYAQNDKSVSAERKEKRRRWWQTIDQEILASDVAGFQLGWRTFSHFHKTKPANTVDTTLQNYAGDSNGRERSKADIVKGWRDTDACLRALFGASPQRLQLENGIPSANRMLAGAFVFAKPNGDFARAFPGSSRADAHKLSAVYEKFLNGRHYDQLINDQGRIAVLRSDLRETLGTM